MKEIFEAVFTGLFVRDFALAVKLLESSPFLTDASRGALARRRAQSRGTDKSLVQRVLRYEGMTMEFCPMAMTSFDDGDAAVKKQQEIIKALAPAMYDGMVLCARTPVSQGPTVFYGFKVKGGRACKLRVRLEEEY